MLAPTVTLRRNVGDLDISSYQEGHLLRSRKRSANGQSKGCVYQVFMAMEARRFKRCQHENIVCSLSKFERAVAPTRPPPPTLDTSHPASIPSPTIARTADGKMKEDDDGSHDFDIEYRWDRLPEEDAQAGVWLIFAVSLLLTVFLAVDVCNSPSREPESASRSGDDWGARTGRSSSVRTADERRRR